MNNKNFKEKLTEKRIFIRFLEMFPGLTSWTIIIMPVVLAIYNPIFVMYFIICFDLYWFFRAMNIARSTMAAYRNIKKAATYDWLERCRETENVPEALKKAAKELKKLIKMNTTSGKHRKILIAKKKSLKNKIHELEKLESVKDQIANWNEIYHVVIYSTFKEELDTLEPALKALSKSNFPLKQKVIYCLAGEERDKERFRNNALHLTKKYKKEFFKFLPLEHPEGLPNEGKVKGAAVSWAAQQVRTILHKEGIKSENIIVSSLDSDTRIHHNFLAALTYKFVTTPKRHQKSFQPIPLFHNNLWEAPAPSRVMAVNSSFWQMIESMRTYRLRNFAGHAMSMKTLELVDYWDRFSIVEDGKQYWRSYFALDGDYSVVPIFVPVYNDAVLSKTYFGTLKAQYLQRRRWYYGVSDFPFIIINSIRNKKISLGFRLLQIWRHFEGTISLATGSLIIAFVAWLPLLLNPEFGDSSVIAHNLPVITSRIMMAATIGLLTSVWISIILLPKKPKHYSKFKTFFMVTQWLFLPPIVITLSTIPALDAQTRMIFGKYIGFYVTPKFQKKSEKSTII